MTKAAQQDLVLLLPGKDEREGLEGLLGNRHASLGIRLLRFKTFVHPRRDPGCFAEAPEVLRPLLREAAFALVVFDHEGSGQEATPVLDVEADLRNRLGRAGWGTRAEVVAIEPEFEAWVWSDSNQVDTVLGWAGLSPSLRAWLTQRGFLAPGKMKPGRPKEALESALAHVRVRRSSALYRRLAERVGLERCEDIAFARLKAILTRWFGNEGPDDAPQ